MRRILTVILGLVLIGYALLPPLGPLEKASWVGYAICHQIPDRSFHIAGRQLPLCARCTGTYIGVAIGFASLALLRRWRAAEMLSPAMIVVMVLFIGTMGVDGLNSYLSLLGNMPTLYTPRNWLRAATGSLNGLALSMIVWPIFNLTLWASPHAVRPLKNAWELLGVVAVDAGAIAVAQAQPAPLLYPLALISTGGVLWMLTLVNTMILLILFRKDSQAERWHDAVLPLLSGLVATLFELTAMGTFRYLITGSMGWPLW